MKRGPLTLLLSLLALSCGSAPPQAQPPAASATAAASADPAPTAAAATGRGAPVDPGPIPVSAGDPSWGSALAPVTIVEFCEFTHDGCAAAQDTLRALKGAYGPEKLRIVWKSQAVPAYRDDAVAGLQAALTAFALQGNDGFWRAHDRLFAGVDDPEAAAAEVLPALGTADQLAKVRAEVEAKLAQDQALAEKVGARGSASFAINGALLRVDSPLAQVKAKVDAQLEAAAALRDAGVPAAEVYTRLAMAGFKAPALRDPPAHPLSDKNVYKVPVGSSPSMGKSDALVTIVEFGDFQCPFCRRAERTMIKLRAQLGDQLRFVWKHEPLGFHERADAAAMLSLEARAQKGDAGFWKVKDTFFSAPKATAAAMKEALDEPHFTALIAALGLNEKATLAAIGSRKHRGVVNDDMVLADALGVDGTPQFFINGRKLTGSQSTALFRTLIDEQLAIAQGLVKGGVKPAQVYDAIIRNGVEAAAPETIDVAAAPKDAPSRGPAGAKVILQVFGDFECPFTRKLMPALEDIEDDLGSKLRIVWRNLPLDMHPHAGLAAEAAMEALAQKGNKGFWAMAKLLFEGQGTEGGLERAAIEGYGKKVGLDAKKLTAALDDHRHQAAIAVDQKAARDAGIAGTPTAAVNRYLVRGARSAARYRRLTRMALAEAK